MQIAICIRPSTFCMPKKGLEPLRLAAPAPETGVSAISPPGRGDVATLYKRGDNGYIVTPERCQELSPGNLWQFFLKQQTLTE